MRLFMAIRSSLTSPSLRSMLAVLAFSSLAACGGGGGGGGSTPPVTVNVAALTVDNGPVLPASYVCTTADQTLGGCTPGSAIGSVNVPTVTLKVCLPGTTNCMTIDHVWVDTGSSGLRLQYGAIAALTSTNGSAGASFYSAMPAVANQTTSSTVECVQFGSGYTFGPVVNLDVYILTNGGSSYEKAPSLNVQIAGAPTASSADVSGATSLSSCEAGLPPMNDIYAMGENGLMGVGLFVNDCTTGNTCTAGQGANMYYSCTSAGCQEVSVSTTQQVANPVSSAIASDTLTTTDNNGVVLSLPTVASLPATVAGNATPPPVNGSLILGVGTRSNNTVGPTVLTAGYQNSTLLDIGNINVTLTAPSGAPAFTGSASYSPYSFLDSGSNAYFVPDLAVACDSVSGGWFAPTSPLTYSLTLTGSPDPNSRNVSASPHTTTASMTIGNAPTLFNTGNIAFSSLAGPSTSCVSGLPAAPTTTGFNTGVDLGLPFFFGRNISVVTETGSVAQGASTYYGPLWAF